jgi:hypothetical protein
VGAEPPARTSQFGGRFPEGVRRQTQVASAARMAVQQVAADVVGVLCPRAPTSTHRRRWARGGAHPPRRHHTRRRRQQGERGAVRCTWDNAGTRGLRSRTQLRRPTGRNRRCAGLRRTRWPAQDWQEMRWPAPAQLRRSSATGRPCGPIRPYVPASPPLVRVRACHLVRAGLGTRGSVVYHAGAPVELTSR